MLLPLCGLVAASCVLADEEVGGEHEGPGGKADSTGTSAGEGLVHGVAEGSTEAIAILDFVNVASYESLDQDVRLDRRAAAGIVENRPFSTLAELDEVPYVAATAFARLLDHVREHVIDEPPADDLNVAVPLYPHDAYQLPLMPSLEEWPYHLLIYLGSSSMMDYEKALAREGIEHQDVMVFASVVDDWTTSNQWITNWAVADYLEDQAGAPLADIAADPDAFPEPIQNTLALYRLMRDHIFAPAEEIPELAEASAVRDVEVVLGIPPVQYFHLWDMSSVTYKGDMWLYDRQEFEMPISSLDPWTRQRLHDNERIAETLPYATSILLRVPTSNNGRITPLGILNDAYWIGGY